MQGDGDFLDHAGIDSISLRSRAIGIAVIDCDG